MSYVHCWACLCLPTSLWEKHQVSPKSKKIFNLSFTSLFMFCCSLMHLHSAVKFEKRALNVWPHLLGALLIAYRNTIISIQTKLLLLQSIEVVLWHQVRLCNTRTPGGSVSLLQMLSVTIVLTLASHFLRVLYFLNANTSAKWKCQKRQSTTAKGRNIPKILQEPDFLQAWNWAFMLEPEITIKFHQDVLICKKQNFVRPLFIMNWVWLPQKFQRHPIPRFMISF